MSKEIIMAETAVEAEAPPVAGGLTEGQQAVAAAEDILRNTAAGSSGAVNRAGGLPSPEEIRRMLGVPEPPGSTGTTGGDAGGEGSTDRPGGGGRPPAPPEGPRGPEGGMRPEWLTSPERGREIVKEIVRLEATMGYTERYQVREGRLSITNPDIYNERNGTYLDQLFEDLKDYTRALRRVRNQRDPWNPVIAYREIKRRLLAIVRGEPVSGTQLSEDIIKRRGERPSVLPAEPLNALFDKYKGDNLDVAEGDLATYFQEARALGLLDRADAIFTVTYRQITQGNIPADQVEEMLEKNSELAKRAIEGAFRARRTDPNIARLQGIAEAYSIRTADIFQLKLMDVAYAPIEGEFRFGEDMDEKEDTETYWRPGHYKAMYEIIAKTMKEFTKAKDSFLRMITGGALGKSPDELYEYFNNFTGMFGQTASAQGIDDDYVKASRLELTGRGYTFGADYSFETYNMKSANQFLMAMALHEGPEREVELARSANGEVAPHLWKFDYDPRVILLHNPGGSRGQLLSDTVTQHYLHQEIRNILIEEGMGVVLKNYRPDAQYLTDDEESAQLSRDFNKIQSELTNGRRLSELSEQDQELYITALSVFRTEQELKANLKRIGIHQKVEEFKGLYEGFDDGLAHIANFRKFGAIDLKKLPDDLRKSVIIGKVQLRLQGHEGKDKKLLLGVIDELIAANRLTVKDKRIWTEAYDQSKTNFDTAFQMVGATGEKARRGGGVFFIDRKDERDRRFVDNMPVYLAEKFIQCGETLTKIKYADDAEIWNRADFAAQIRRIPNFKAMYRTAMVEVVRARSIRSINKGGFDAKLYDADYPADFLSRAVDYIGKLDQDGNLDEIDKLRVGLLQQMTIKRPKENPNGTLMRNPDGSVVVEGILVDFDTAVKSIYSRWTNHTYWGYQQENRHMLTDPDVLAAAKRIRAGLSRPEDEDNLATLLLIVDPTLTRVKRLEDTQVREGESAMQQEIILFEAAVEASNIGHWRIVRELHAAFMPKDGNPFKMRTGYNLEDYSGIARFIIRTRQYIAAHSKRFARRYAAEIANLPLNVSSMPDQLGQEGVMGAIEMFADPIGEMAKQEEASQFAITKWVDQMRIGNMLFGALVGQVDPERGFSIEGLFEKPTNNSDKLQQVGKKITELMDNAAGEAIHYDTEDEFMYAVMESFDRLWIVLKLVRTMESDTRNAQGVLDLEKTDIFLADGKINANIVTGKIGSDTGSSRHTEKIFFDKYIKWLTDGQGQEAYPGEKWWYRSLLEKTILDPEPDFNKKMTRAQWIFNKMGR